jgi:hypothetical protein
VRLVDRLSQILDLLPALATGGVLTAAVVQTGHVAVEWMKGRNRRAEIKATSDAEIRRLQAELQLERETQPRPDLQHAQHWPSARMTAPP